MRCECAVCSCVSYVSTSFHFALIQIYLPYLISLILNYTCCCILQWSIKGPTVYDNIFYDILMYYVPNKLRVHGAVSVHLFLVSHMLLPCVM